MSKGSDIGNIMKQAQQLQERLAQVQAEAGNRTVEGTAGGGMVTAAVNGRLEVSGLRIEKQVVEAGDLEMLQDLSSPRSTRAFARRRR